MMVCPTVELKDERMAALTVCLRVDMTVVMKAEQMVERMAGRMAAWKGG